MQPSRTSPGIGLRWLFEIKTKQVAGGQEATFEVGSWQNDHEAIDDRRLLPLLEKHLPQFQHR